MRLPDLPLNFRHAAAREIAHTADTLKQVEDNSADCRLNRDRLARLRPLLPDPELNEAIEHLDQAVIELGAIRRRLGGK
jgi:hypothetical protein